MSNPMNNTGYTETVTRLPSRRSWQRAVQRLAAQGWAYVPSPTPNHARFTKDGLARNLFYPYDYLGIVIRAWGG